MSSGGPNPPATIWLRLQNARNVIAQLNATSAAIGRLTRQTAAQGVASRTAAERTWLHNQALFTLRRYAYAATLSITALAGVAGHLGYNFFTQMQTGRLAFTRFLGSTEAANKELNSLYRLAALTPFEFPDIILATRRLLAFGSGLDLANNTVRNVVDSLSAMGITSGSALNRATLALGHMLSIGRVTGGIVYQLAKDNVPMVQALEEQFHLTGDQMRRVGTLGIPAKAALEALNRYIEGNKKFAGMGIIMGTRSLSGLLTTFKDFSAQLFGTIETPWFEGIQRMLGGRSGTGGLVTVIQNMSQAYTRGGWTEMFREMGKGGRVGSFLAPIFMKLVQVVHALWLVFSKSLIPAIQSTWHAIMPLLAPALLLLNMLIMLAHHTTFLRIAITFLVAVWTMERIVSMYVWIWGRRLIVMRLFAIRVTSILTARQAVLNWVQLIGAIRSKQITFAEALLFLGRKRMAALVSILTARYKLWTAWAWASARATNGQFAAGFKANSIWARMSRSVLLLGNRIKFATLALWGMTRAMITFLLTNPIGWAILVVFALVMLYWRWKAFRDLVNNTARWMWRHWPYVAIVLALTLGPIGAMIAGIGLLVKYFRTLVHWAKSAGHWIGRIHIPGGGFIRTALHYGFGLPGAASGGIVTRAGSMLVGERGPELAVMPAGASIVPLPSKVGGGMGSHIPAFPEEINLKVVLRVDGRDLADVAVKHRLDRKARK